MNARVVFDLVGMFPCDGIRDDLYLSEVRAYICCIVVDSQDKPFLHLGQQHKLWQLPASCSAADDRYCCYGCFCCSSKEEEEKRIEKEQAAKDRYWKLPVCYDDDDDEESSIPLKDIIYELPRVLCKSPPFHQNELSHNGGMSI
ncbi:hypothetical protein Tco_1163176 [Tanacetum coccineum]